MTAAKIHTLADKPGRSPVNRSLERGVEILRAFRPGSELLANGDLAERTGLARSTVSRLTQTLVGAGMLQMDTRRRAYRLAPAVLSLAHAMKSGSTVLGIAAPKMREVAERERINVGLAAPDRDEMVYLESIRYSRRVSWRKVVSGQRVPMELTSLGRAYLSTVTETRRRSLYRVFKKCRGAQWPQIRRAEHEPVEFQEPLRCGGNFFGSKDLRLHPGVGGGPFGNEPGDALCVSLGAVIDDCKVFHYVVLVVVNIFESGRNHP